MLRSDKPLTPQPTAPQQASRNSILKVECGDDGNLVVHATGSFSGDNVASESLLPIVASQRERFKVRNMELEAVGFCLDTRFF